MTRMKLVSLTLFFSLMVMAHSVGAEYLIKGAMVTAVQNTSSNGENFSIRTIGGTGPCVGKFIIFPADSATNIRIYERAYQSALTALTDGFRVNIYDYAGTSCNNATFIDVAR